MERSLHAEIEFNQAAAAQAAGAHEQIDLQQLFYATRAQTEYLAAPLSPEDASISVTEDTSPAKWHLAHTTWFFERFLLRRFLGQYEAFDPNYDFLFNSYYQSLGKFLPKAERPNLSRPSLAEILEYRGYVEEKMAGLFGLDRAVDSILEIGIHHEQQHQELLMMDIKRNFYASPLKPAYHSLERALYAPREESRNFLFFEGGKTEIGFEGEGFAYDNEGARHTVWIEPFEISADLVTNGEYLEFVEAGGYTEPKYWLSDGWDCVRAHAWQAPLYWAREGSGWSIFSLAGNRPLEPAEPVSHLSYYEAQAYARWKNCRLPTEQEWELAARTQPVAGQFLEEGSYRPRPGGTGAALSQMHGTLWQWTQSSYLPYPGYRPFDEELAEYNGKFFSNQMVLRGGSCVTPLRHYRPTYRNFYYPHMRWQYAGLRLARDANTKQGRVIQ